MYAGTALPDSLPSGHERCHCARCPRTPAHTVPALRSARLWGRRARRAAAVRRRGRARMPRPGRHARRLPRWSGGGRCAARDVSGV